MEKSKILRLLKSLVIPDYRGKQPATLQFKDCSAILSGCRESSEIVIFSPGFASAATDYGPLVRVFERSALVLRVHHHGSSRFHGLVALSLFLGKRLRGIPSIDSAKQVRTWIHREENRKRRLRQVGEVLDWVRENHQEKSIHLAGHSFGTDTALLAALEHRPRKLTLFSPHPPGYLVPKDRYSEMACQVTVFVGSRDRTRDGVGPQDRLQVVEHLPPDSEAHSLQGLAHMDFAFTGLGPKNWENSLLQLLK